MKGLEISIDLEKDDLERIKSERRRNKSTSFSLLALRGYSEASTRHLDFISDVLNGTNQIDFLEVRMPLNLTSFGLIGFLNLFMKKEIKVTKFRMLRQLSTPTQYFSDVNLNCSVIICRELDAFVKRCSVEALFLHQSPLSIENPENVRHFFDFLPNTVLNTLYLPALRSENSEALEQIKSLTHDVLPFSKLQQLSIGNFAGSSHSIFDMSRPEDSLLFDKLCAVEVGMALLLKSRITSHPTQGSVTEPVITETSQPTPSTSSSLMLALATQPREIRLEIQHEYFQKKYLHPETQHECSQEEYSRSSVYELD